MIAALYDSSSIYVAKSKVQMGGEGKSDSSKCDE
jgi:hypothetical protein